MDQPTEKTCGTCRKIKLVTEFHRDRSRQGGFEACCKACRSAARMALRGTVNTGTCLHCGEEFARKGVKGIVPAYCYKTECYRRCDVDGCDEWGRTKGYCATHYARYRKHGDPTAGPIYEKNYNGELCAVDSCEATAVSKTYCEMHYQRLRKHGDPLVRLVVEYNQPCTVEGCDRTDMIRHGYCVMHYYRWRTHGDPLNPGRVQYRRDDPSRPLCQAEGCDKPFAVNGYCRKHLYRWNRYGDPDGQAQYPPHSPCRTCADPPPHARYREFCSEACYVAYRVSDGEPPLTGECFACQIEIPFLTVDSSGKKCYRQSRWCHDCRMRARSAPHAMTVEQLARRDGTDCKLCRKPIDMTLKRNDPGGMLAPSVDHMAPLSRGGLNVPENLQLTHLLCNIRKRDRVIT